MAHGCQMVCQKSKSAVRPLKLFRRMVKPAGLWFLKGRWNKALLEVVDQRKSSLVSLHMNLYIRGLCLAISIIVIVQLLSCVQFFVTPQTAARQSSLAFPVSRSLLKLMSIGLVMPSNHLFLCYPLLFPPSIFLSIRIFSNEWALCIRRPKYWSFEYYESMNVYIFVEEYVSPLWKPLVAILYNIEWEYTQTW